MPVTAHPIPARASVAKPRPDADQKAIQHKLCIPSPLGARASSEKKSPRHKENVEAALIDKTLRTNFATVFPSHACTQR